MRLSRFGKISRGHILHIPVISLCEEGRSQSSHKFIEEGLVSLEILMLCLFTTLGGRIRQEIITC
jgi:hypothetical protein